MKPSSNSNTNFFYHNDHTTPPQNPNSTQLPPQSQSNAALTIQSIYRSHRIRTLYRKISTVDSEADHLQRLIQLQDTVDSIRNNHLEKLKMNEALMNLLLKLDSVPGIDPAVREARRKVTRRIVGLQEILDSVSEAKVDECDWWSVNNWDRVMEQMEESICREKGGDDLENFCAQTLGFRCLQRFLREP
ncbi:BAG family molecular chaperone regulator 5, mitochondrial [Vicia villosa]|uniref:BAG family molecular chaperone regulator 5, mitochondrial n=1 Tax=Vicia villosa TaxID=3911 RepID=UPI00273BE62A|nr:BAG family molecular chaperone regulator 5, mitochondrial [Vicia villosa]